MMLTMLIIYSRYCFNDGDERYDSDDDVDDVMLKIVIPRSDVNEMC